MSDRKIPKTRFSADDERQFNDVIELAVREFDKGSASTLGAKPKHIPKATKLLVKLTDRQRVQFIIFLMEIVHEHFQGNKMYDGPIPQHMRALTAITLITHALLTKPQLDDQDVEVLIKAFMTYRRSDWSVVTEWPVDDLIQAIEQSYKTQLPDAVKQNIETLKNTIHNINHNDKYIIKLVDKIDTFLFKHSSGGNTVKPILFLGDDRFALYANDIIKQQPASDKQTWYKLIALAQKASGARPSEKYFAECKVLVHELPADKFKHVVNTWFEFVARLKETSEQHTYNYGNGHVTNYQTYDFLNTLSMDALKGFVWMSAHVYDVHTLNVIASLCERCFKKIPGKGPAAASLGNACILLLYASSGMEGIAHLSRLKLRIKQSNTQTLIENYLQTAASKRGMSVTEIEDLAVDDFELHDGKREYDLEGYKAILSIQGVGDVSTEWFKPDDTLLKSVPSLVKEKHAEQLKEIKDTAKQIEVTLVAQRDRIDRKFRSQREMTWGYFNKYYFSHGLLSWLTKNMLWKFRKGDDVTVAIFIHGQWTTLSAETIQPDDDTLVLLWHPAIASVKDIRAWREWLITEKIKQPVKQAFREVYILTDAEANTRIYSNRMAAHILKQHQFNSLAKTRGWKYSLLGNYDDGRDNEIASLQLPDVAMRAEFWVNEVSADNAYNDTGIWNYVATDQVRFVNTTTNEAFKLVSVPPVLFSEVMRDVDLFVGVASVGNDPAWSDNGGLPAHRDYWQSYSFGELTEIAKTRKEILLNLVPRLKLASVATVGDKFLIVKGKVRTYKIHMGSTNILMEPNDEYLCIVPDRSKKDPASSVFLPFEGDAGLSIILSKAVLLMDDDKITDTTILTQINRR